MPPLRGTTLDGQPVTEEFSRPTVVYVFSPSCSWCERNLNNARAIASGAGDRYRFVGVAAVDAGIEGYVRERSLRWDIIKNVPLEILRQYRVPGTPQTILIGAGGIVLHSWNSAYLETAQREIEAALKVSLPGLLED